MGGPFFVRTPVVRRILAVAFGLVAIAIATASYAMRPRERTTTPGCWAVDSGVPYQSGTQQPVCIAYPNAPICYICLYDNGGSATDFDACAESQSGGTSSCRPCRVLVGVSDECPWEDGQPGW